MEILIVLTIVAIGIIVFGIINSNHKSDLDRLEYKIMLSDTLDTSVMTTIMQLQIRHEEKLNLLADKLGVEFETNHIEEKTETTLKKKK